MGTNSKATETLKWIAEALEGAVGLRHRFRDYSDPCLLPHVVLLLE